MIYAPIIIPTLCRFEQFKNCIESLSNCVWAEKTDIFIGLDYPIKESHWPGYKKIKSYLESSDINNLKFKKINVILRTHNLGIGPNGNSSNLFNEIFKSYDRLIFTEDDNIFSPNFLVYMNKSLEYFKNDKKVLAINGYKHPYKVKFNNNTFYKQNVDFSAWGYGIWKDRTMEWGEICNKYFREKLDFNSFIKVLKHGNNRAIQFLHYSDKNWTKYITDDVLSVYAIINDFNVIMPSISLVRNLGFDCNGVNWNNCPDYIIKQHINQIISEDNTYELIGTGDEFYNENKIIHVRSSFGKQSKFKLIIAILKYIIHNIF